MSYFMTIVQSLTNPLDIFYLFLISFTIYLSNLLGGFIMSVLGVVGLLLGIAALIVLSYKGVNAFVSSLIAAAIVIITNGMPFWGTFSDSYATGMKNFAGSYFLIFGLAAAYGELMKISGAA